MQWIIQHWEDILGIIFALILIAEVIVNITPTERDNSILLIIKKIISAIAPNRVKKRYPTYPADDPETFETESRITRRRRNKSGKA